MSRIGLYSVYVVLALYWSFTSGFELRESKHKDQDCPYKCRISGKEVCGPVPCPPPPPCPFIIHTPGDCCPHCKGKRAVHDDAVSDNDDANLLRTSFCPHPCTQGGVKYCFHIPCPFPPCSDPTTTAGECCQHCPNGPNCDMSGHTIPFNQTMNIAGMTCTCRQPGKPGTVECSTP